MSSQKNTLSSYFTITSSRYFSVGLPLSLVSNNDTIPSTDKCHIARNDIPAGDFHLTEQIDHISSTLRSDEQDIIDFLPSVHPPSDFGVIFPQSQSFDGMFEESAVADVPPVTCIQTQASEIRTWLRSVITTTTNVEILMMLHAEVQPVTTFELHLWKT